MSLILLAQISIKVYLLNVFDFLLVDLGESWLCRLEIRHLVVVFDEVYAWLGHGKLAIQPYMVCTLVLNLTVARFDPGRNLTTSLVFSAGFEWNLLIRLIKANHEIREVRASVVVFNLRRRSRLHPRLHPIGWLV